MTYPFPPELGRKVQELMSAGGYQSEDELLFDAMLALEDVAKREVELRTEIGRRLRNADASLSQLLDRFAFKAEARRQLGANG
jgi:Arc/MetJ-type ribon-helix-helix transcriptional regulator